LLFERARRTFPEPKMIGEAAKRVRQITGGPIVPGLDPDGVAQQAMELLRDGMVLTPGQRAALEAMIRITRPAPLTRDGEVGNLPPECVSTFPHWDTFRQAIQPFLYSIGRVERVSDSQTIGTGFMIGPNLLVTNRHVLDDLSMGSYSLEKGQAQVFFKAEWDSIPEEPPVPVVGVVSRYQLADLADIALLELESRDFLDARPPLRPAATTAQLSQSVSAIGYPSRDGRSPMFTDAIFGRRLEVKRVAPGEVVRLSSGSIFHDCSTLGGNSGSPVLSMESCEVVGVHREGRYMYYNEAVDAPTLAEFLRPYI
jgi:endonuclease G